MYKSLLPTTRSHQTVPKKFPTSAASREWNNLRAHFFARGDVGKEDEAQADETRKGRGHGEENAPEGCECEAEDAPVRAMLEVGQTLERPRTHEVDRRRAHVKRADTKSRDDHEKIRGDGERSDDTVERERGIEYVEVDKEGDTAFGNDHARLHLECLCDTLDTDEEDNADKPRDENGRRRKRHKEGAEQQDRKRECDLDRLDAAPAGKIFLDDNDPMHNLAVVEKILERDEEQKGAAERRDSDVCRFEIMSILHRIEDREVEHDERPESRSRRDDEYGEHETRTEDGNGYAPLQEALLPDRLHPLEYLGVHDRVVEGEGRLQDGKERDRKERGPSAPDKSGDARCNSDNSRKDEDSHTRAWYHTLLQRA